MFRVFDIIVNSPVDFVVQCATVCRSSLHCRILSSLQKKKKKRTVGLALLGIIS